MFRILHWFIMEGGSSLVPVSFTDGGSLSSTWKGRRGFLLLAWLRLGLYLEDLAYQFGINKGASPNYIGNHNVIVTLCSNPPNVTRFTWASQKDRHSVGFWLTISWTVALHKHFVVRIGLTIYKEVAVQHYSSIQSCFQAALGHLVVTQLMWNM